MSKENVALFVRAANKKPELNERLAKTDSTADWVKIAESAGFEFTAEEFCSVVGETIQKNVTTDNAVREFLAARDVMGAPELSQSALETVVGGEVRKLIKVPPIYVGTDPPLEPLR